MKLRLILLLLLPGLASAGPPTYELVAKSGDAAPGGALSSFSTFGSPVIGPRGDVVFTAEVSEAGPGTNSIFVRRPGGTVLRLATREDAAPLYPGEGSKPFRSFSAPAVDGAGRVSFIAGLKLVPGNVEAWEDQGIWIRPDGGNSSVPLWMIVRENHRASLAANGSLIPSNSNPPMFDRFLGLRTSPNGALTFRAALKSFPTTIHNGKSGLWIVATPLIAPDYDHAPAALAVTGLTAPDGGGAGFIHPGSASPLAGDSVAFSSSIHPDRPLTAEGIWTGPAGNLVRAAGIGGPAPDTTAGHAFFEFGVPGSNAAGELVLQAATTSSGGEGEGIWTRHSGELRALALSGQNVPGVPDFKFESFSDPVVNGRGQASFLATACTSSGEKIGLVCLGGHTATLRVVARGGTVTPGAPDRYFHTFSAPLLNATGQLVFSALVGSSPDLGDESGVWGMDSGGDLQLVAMKSKTLPLSPGDTRTVGSVSASSFNDAGEIALQLRFSDASTAVMIARLAVPSVGSYTAWAALNIAPGLPAAPQDDADGDGEANVLEFAFGSDPDSGSSIPNQSLGLFEGGGLTGITFSRRTGLTEYQCVVESSPNLVDWTARPTAESDSILRSDGTEIVTALVPNEGGERQFLRIRVEAP